MQVNPRPTYTLRPAYSTTRKVLHAVYEIYDSTGEHICRIDARSGNVMEKLLKRGIPLDDAQKLADQM